jgi:AAHS family 4-hydroxybenzoate transporter-like MFS transporter
VGWALGIGRVGGILGPIVIGAALAAQWSAGAVFYAMAVPMLVAGVAVLLLGRLYGTRRNRATTGARAEDSVPEAVPGEGAQA